MKKRIISFICILVLVLAATSAVFAGGLEVTKVTPADGNKGAQPSNMAVKLTFNDTMVQDNETPNSKDRFSITDAAGAEQDFQLVCSDKYPDELWLVLNSTLEQKAEYTVSIKAGVESINGNTYPETKVISTFTTRNTSRDGTISTVMMFGMFAVIMGISTVSAKKKQMEEQPMTMAQVEKLNPYKLAKAKNVSLAEAEAYIKKEKEKARKAEEKALEAKRAREAMAAEERAKIEAEVDSEERRNGWFRVHTKCSFTAHGHEVPKFVKKKNAAKRKAAEERAKKYAKNKKKK